MTEVVHGEHLDPVGAAARPRLESDATLSVTLGPVGPVPTTLLSYAGFALKPVGFFDGNPALDVPPPARHGAGHCHA